MQAAARIFLGNGNHQAEIGLGQLVLGGLVPRGDPFRQIHLFVGRQQLHLADLLQVHPHRVIQVVLGGQVHRVHQFLFLYLTQVDLSTQVISHWRECIIQIQIQLQICTHNLDAQRIKFFVNFFNLFRRDIQLFQFCVQL